MPKPMLAVFAALVILSGCASGRDAEQAREAQSTLVGMPVATLLSCAGVPDRREAADAEEYFTYDQRGGVRRGSSASIGVGGGGGNLGLGLGLGFPLGGGGSSGCVATFTVRQGRVSQLAYRQDGGDDPGACYPLVENCLALIPWSQ